MGENRKDGGDSGAQSPDKPRGPTPEQSSDGPLERVSSRDMNPDRRRHLIAMTQLLAALAALAHEVSKLLG